MGRNDRKTLMLESAVAVSIRALILDFDGTIVDTETPTFRVWREIYGESGFELDLETWKAALGTYGVFDPWAELLRRHGQDGRPPVEREVVHERLARECAGQGLRPV